MIIDLDKFIREEKAYWEELEQILDRRQRDPAAKLSIESLKRFHYLYQRVSADLARISTFAAEKETRTYLETLVARAFGEIHETREAATRFRMRKWFFHSLPGTFRRQKRAFYLAVAVTIAGCLFGGVMISANPDTKKILLPFEHLLQNPSDRVANEEANNSELLRGSKAQGAAWYWQHNTRVSAMTLALGISWGIGTIVSLFYNGVILGAVTFDYFLAGQGTFLLAWLLPHGSVEIPAILIAGQAGFVIAGAMLGRKSRQTLRERFRRVSSDLVNLFFGIVLLLLWAGIIESFFSQYHEPYLPYWVKLVFGSIQLTLLVLWLTKSGKKAKS